MYWLTAVLLLSVCGYVWVLYKLVRTSQEVAEMRQQLQRLCRPPHLRAVSDNGHVSRKQAELAAQR